MWYYVKRTSKTNPAGIAYVGPIRGEAQAFRERDAWQDAGESAQVLAAEPTVKVAVKTWERVTKAGDACHIVTFQGQKMTMARYRLNHEGNS